MANESLAYEGKTASNLEYCCGRKPQVGCAPGQQQSCEQPQSNILACDGSESAKFEQGGHTLADTGVPHDAISFSTA
eukprot:11688178-Karenia_brevis.AAC.1